MNHNPITWPLVLGRKADFSLQVKDDSPMIRSISETLGCVLVLLFLIRLSVLSLWLPSSMQLVLHQGDRVVLVASFIFFVAKGVGKAPLTGIAFVVLTFPGVMMSGHFSQSFLKWAGVALLFIVVGPVIQSDQARSFRQAAWNTFRLAFIVISIASVSWYFLRLSNLGRGAFTGVMMHAMLIGPIAGMAVLFCAHLAFLKRSITFASLSILFVIPCLLTGSRSAVLALVFGFMVLVVLYLRRGGLIKTALIIWLTLLIAFLCFAFFKDVMSSETLNTYTSALQQKGWTHTRREHWEARWAEFNHSPVVGIGIGIGEGRGTVIDAAGNVNVEPGSSYLALLSMTGLAGALGFLAILANIFRSARMNKSMMMSDASVFPVLMIGAFLAVHMITEGYIFAVGSPFCLLFWLCLGRMNDLLNTRI